MTLGHEHFMEMAIEEGILGAEEGNSPVGSVITRDNEVIARGHNLVTSTVDVTAHAETVALRNAGLATGDIELQGATLYTTFEPCPMCTGAIVAARISTVVLGGRNRPAGTTYGDYTIERLIEMVGFSDRINIVTGVLQERGESIRNDWLKQRGLA